jgi:hypothetical protein
MTEEVTHKILVNKETGKMIYPVYPIDAPRPAPPDAEWHEIQPNSIPYKIFISTEDLTHLDLGEVYWDFEGNNWIEVPTSSVVTFEHVKTNRNELLKSSDRHIAQATDQTEINQWIAYRAGLRTLFENKSADFDWNMIVFPRMPSDINALHEKAANGDTEAAAIIEEEGL